MDVAQGLNDGINEFAMNVIPTAGNINLGTTTHVISRSGLARLASMYRSVLEAMAADAEGDASVACLPEGSWGRAAGEVVEWSGGSTLELFEARALSAPGSAAVVFGGERVTFGELEERANRLARHLRGLGVDAGAVVGVCLDRGPGVLVAMLAAWKTGAAYVPVDRGCRVNAARTCSPTRA